MTKSSLFLALFVAAPALASATDPGTGELDIDTTSELRDTTADETRTDTSRGDDGGTGTDTGEPDDPTRGIGSRTSPVFDFEYDNVAQIEDLCTAAWAGDELPLRDWFRDWYRSELGYPYVNAGITYSDTDPGELPNSGAVLYLSGDHDQTVIGLPHGGTEVFVAYCLDGVKNTESHPYPWSAGDKERGEIWVDVEAPHDDVVIMKSNRGSDLSGTYLARSEHFPGAIALPDMDLHLGDDESEWEALVITIGVYHDPTVEFGGGGIALP